VKERLLKLLGPVGVPVLYVVCLAIFAALTFPYRRLKEHIVGDFNAAQRAGGGMQELQIDDLSGYWLSGVRMSGVTLLTASPEAGKAPTKIELDEATARYSLLALLVGYSDINFDALAFGGEASGSYDVGGKDRSVDVTLDSIDVGKLQPLVDLLGVPLGGKLAGAVHLTMPDGKASKGTGSVSFEIQDASVGDGKAKIKGALALPKIDVGTLTFAADAKDGVLKITKLVAGGRDLEVQGEGRITMRELATDSLLDLQIRFRINDAYRAKSDITKSLFGAPGSNAPALFEMADPKIKQSKRPDGFYGWIFRGPLGRPDVSPAGMVGAAPMAPLSGGFPAPKAP
jgi:type II secretion system protein N